MPKIRVDGHDVEVPAGYTVLQATEKAGVEVPHFCYHQRLSIAGNCRMCLVELEGVPKPIASCAMPVAEGMSVHTTSDMAKKARKGVLEFMLINHPLDCPICDQGGECDLQDLTLAYGPDSSRFQDNKRAVTNKEMGPLIKTTMTRCIHCTRCVRFAEEVGGVSEMGAVNRGENMEITAAIQGMMSSEMSGNMIDLCPVGALTSKPYAFQARAWDLKKTESIDVLDAVGSNIRVDSYNGQVKRILPRLNEKINEEWISDKTRFSYDGLQYQRIDQPYIRKDGALQPASWEEAFDAIKTRFSSMKSQNIAAYVGDFVDAETILVLRTIMDHLQSPHRDCRVYGECFTKEMDRSHYLFNTKITKIESSDLCLLIGAHPRYEAPLINARIRKRFLQGHYPIYRLGEKPGSKSELTYPVQDLGADLTILDDLMAGKHPLNKAIKSAKKPIMILGSLAYTHLEGENILQTAAQLAEKFGFIHNSWNGFNVLQRGASRVAALDLGFLPQENGVGISEISEAVAQDKIHTLFLAGVDTLPTDTMKKAYTIYMGHHGDKGAQWADVVLPGAAYTEKEGTFINTEGRAQKTRKAVQPPGQAQADHEILLKLARVLNMDTLYKNPNDVSKGLLKALPYLSYQAPNVPWVSLHKRGGLQGKIPAWKDDFYRDNIISRHSKIMAACSEAFLMNQEEKNV